MFKTNPSTSEQFTSNIRFMHCGDIPPYIDRASWHIVQLTGLPC